MTVAYELGNAAERQLRQACAELDRALAGRPDRAERYLGAYPLLAAQVQSVVELIYAEFITREELGQRPTPEEYYLRFPRWKEALRRQLHVHEWLRVNLDDDAAPLPVAAEGPAGVVPHCLGAYELIEEIGRGGCGGVYKAWQHGLERTVAVKLLPAGAGSPAARPVPARGPRHGPAAPPQHHAGLRRGRAPRRRLFQHAVHSGGALSAWTAAPRPGEEPASSPATVVQWMEAVARAVHHAHRNGVVHCDLKPSNILLDDDDRPLVSDFGLAQEAREGGEGHDLIGSPAYMAPEQITAQPGEYAPPIDVWALGVLLHELLTGRRPFVSDHLPGLRHLICEHEPAPCAARPVDPRPAGGRLRRCLAKDPARRYPSAGALAEDLAACRPA